MGVGDWYYFIAFFKSVCRERLPCVSKTRVDSRELRVAAVNRSDPRNCVTLLTLWPEVVRHQ
jgi:hypothetical protein